ncbi:MAG: TonB-dependent receptor [Bryobacterales bacterium]|nr:TonB-dependent receptor [Bryobacterales bacterium]
MRKARPVFGPRAYLPLLWCLLAVLTTAMWAQERFGDFNGVVTDPSGARLPGVSVTITNKESGRAFTTTTGNDGAYTAPNLEAGRYRLRFEQKGFTPYEVADANLLVGRTLKVDAQLALGTTETTVQVTEAAPLIDTTNTTIANNITAEEIDRLPKGRSFQSLVLTTPSVNAGEVEGGFQVNGASGAENQFNIDGVSTTSLVNGKSRQNAVFEILQEVQVKTSGLDAEYGGALGGTISAITRSGGNAFHGDLHYYYYGNAINAGPTLRLLMDPRTERTAKFVQDNIGTDNNHEVGYSLGGYLIKNKVYFFSAASPRYRNVERPLLFTGGERDNFSSDQTYHMLFNKLTLEPSSKLRVNLSWLWTPTKSLGSLPAYNDEGNTVATSLAAALSRKNIGFFAPQTSYTGQVDWNMTPTTLLTVRGGRFWDNFKTTGIPSFSAVEYASSAAALPFDIPANLRQPTGFNNTPRLQNTFYDLVTRTYVQTDLNKFATFWGQHNLKGGWGFTKTVNKVNVGYPGNGYVRVFWNSGFNSPTLGANQRGQYGFYELNQIGTEGVTGGSMHNMFIQDQWRIIPRLTLTLGVRVENESVPSFQRAVADPAFSFGFGDKIAPRLGASLDVFGNGRMKVFGSWGRYFDWVKYELSRGTFGGDYWRIYYRSLDTTDVFSLNGTNIPGRNIWNNVQGGFRDRRIPGFDSIDPDLKPMSQDNFNGGVEVQLGAQGVFRASYTGTRLRRTIEDLGALDAQGNEVYVYANPGQGVATTQPTSGATAPFPMPKPIRHYDAMELVYTRRFSKGFSGQVSYVLSRLYGNYAGIANSDEITSPSTGLSSSTAQQLGGNIARQGGNANRSWDLDEILFDSRGNVDVRGRLATDRPHVFKLYGNKEVNWGSRNATNFGLFFYAGSGTPLSTQVYTVNQVPVFVNGRGDMGRTPVLTQTDLVIYHDFKMTERFRLRFEANAVNLFNQKTARSRFMWLNRGAGGAQQGSAISLSNVDLFQGYDYNALLAGTADQRSGRGAYDPRYGLSDIFNTGFTGRLGVKFIF